MSFQNQREEEWDEAPAYLAIPIPQRKDDGDN